jgi:hypothetical protein
MMDIPREIEKLRAMKVPGLVERYREVFDKEPRVKHKAWLWKRIAWKIQEQKYGGLSRAAQRRLEELIAEIDLPIKEHQRSVTGAKLRPEKLGEPMVGTILVRKWREQEIRVVVLENGYEWNDVVYRSLSAVAKAVTGSHWNGRLFFRLTERRKAK